jgi:hypothetical protein
LSQIEEPSGIGKLNDLLLPDEILHKTPIRIIPLQEPLDGILAHGMHRSDAQQVLRGITGGGEGVPLVSEEKFNPANLILEQVVGKVDPVDRRRVLSMIVKEMARPILINHATSAPLNGCPARKETSMTVTTRRSAVTLLLWVSDMNKVLVYMAKQTK